MDEKLLKEGVPSDSLIKAEPSDERLKQGAVVVVECFQEIPCDPCNQACQFGAIKHFDDINDLPEIDYERCTGCGVCIAYCPGLAIFVVDRTYTEESSLVVLPYEFSPVPEHEELVRGLDRQGEFVTKAKVTRVKSSGMDNKTSVISVEVPKGYEFAVRNIDFHSRGDKIDR